MEACAECPPPLPIPLPSRIPSSRPPMRIAVLSRNPDLYSTRRLVEAAEARGHEVQILDTLRCTAHLTASGPEVHYEGVRLEPPDAVVPRIGASITFYGLSIVRQFEAMGVWALNWGDRDHALTRQAPGPPVPRQKGDRPPAHGLRPQSRRRGRPHRVGRRAAGDRQAPGGDAGRRRRALRDAEGGRERDPGVPRDEGVPPRPGVHQGGRRRGRAAVRRRRQGGGRDEAAGGRGRVPLEPPPGRERVGDQDQPGRAEDGRGRVQGAGPEGGRRGRAPVGAGAARARSQLVARAGGDRGGDGEGRGRGRRPRSWRRAWPRARSRSPPRRPLADMPVSGPPLGRGDRPAGPTPRAGGGRRQRGRGQAAGRLPRRPCGRRRP